MHNGQRLLSEEDGTKVSFDVVLRSVPFRDLSGISTRRSNQALFQRLPDGTERLTYGGDWDDRPNDYEFSGDGIMIWVLIFSGNCFALSEYFPILHTRSFDISSMRMTQWGLPMDRQVTG